MLWTTGGFTVNVVDLVLAAVLILGLLVGMAQGLIRQMLIMLASYMALIVAAQYYPHIGRSLGPWIGGDSASRGIIALVSTFGVMAAILNWLTYYVYRQTSLPSLAWGDRVAGAGLGLIWGWALAGLGLVIVNFATSLPWQAWEPDRVAFTTLLSRSTLAPFVTGLLPHLFSTMRPWLPLGLPAPFVL